MTPFEIVVRLPALKILEDVADDESRPSSVRLAAALMCVDFSTDVLVSAMVPATIPAVA